VSFNTSAYRGMYNRMLGPLAQPIEALYNDQGTWVSYQLTGHVSRYRESDLVAGGSIQLGDLRILVLWEDLQALGIPRLGLKDRFNVEGRSYSIVHWDENTRTVGADKVAVEIAVRGAGSAVLASVLVLRITGDGDQRITGDGDRRAVREAV